VSKSIENKEENNNHGTNEQSHAASTAQQQLFLAQMQQNQIPVQGDEIDLGELWRAVWAGKFTIIAISFIFAVASIFFALSKANTYKASAILAPASSEGSAGGLGALAGQFGGLASIAGINLGGGGGGDKTALALEILKSRSFIENYISKHELLVPLMAGENWDMVTDTLIINNGLYDQINHKWMREVKPPKKAEPSSWEAFEKFSRLLVISEDKTTSMVTIEIEFFSPTMAQEWLTWLISDINDFIRDEDQKEAQDSINYLTNQLENIQVTTMETVFYQLIEEQTKNMMLTKIKAEYVLKTIDPPQVPDKKAGPKRAVMVILGTMIGGVLSVLIVLIRYFTKKQLDN
jgi:LPS O-antigen subunit length determinant protein (WzzB/FepE family)